MGTSFISGLRGLRAALALFAVLSAGMATAQNTASPQTIPGLENFSLDPVRPTPRATPAPAPTTRPQGSPSPEPTASAPPPVVPTVRATPTPRATVPRPVPTPVPTVTVAPLPVATPLPVPEAPALTPLPPTTLPETLPSAAPRPVAVAGGIDMWGWAAILGIAVVVAAVGFALWRRVRLPDEREEVRRDERHETFALGVSETPVDLPQPAPPAPPAAPAMPVTGEPRALLELTLTPKRAGTNLLSASVEYRLGVSNSGALPATAVRLDIRLLSAGPSQDAILGALFASPIPQPIVAPFDVPSGAMLELEGLAMHPRDTLELLGAGEPALFVPVVSVSVRYGWAGGGAGQTARSYVVGLVREEGARLQPFRRDGARMHDTVAALEYAVAVTG